MKAGHKLLVTTDTLVSGIHFPAGTDPEAIGHKALAVNLSDIAAMGGVPVWYTLSLTLPEDDEDWLSGFSRGLHTLAGRHEVALIGGDTTRGPLSITITVLGDGGAQSPIMRSGARPGDVIAVTGELGNAAMALRCLQHDAEAGLEPGLRLALDRPEPRLTEGLMMRAYAHAMIDISDGLTADLGHILATSGVGAEVDVESLPVTRQMMQAGASIGLDEAACRQLAMTGGDDYELCAVMSRAAYQQLRQAWRTALANLTMIGTITPSNGITLKNADDWPDEITMTGYRHFT